MINAYERLVELLGAPRHRNADILIKIIDDLAEQPLVDCTHERKWFYDFHRSGVSLVFDCKVEIFEHLTLFISVDSNDESIKAFSGELPYGITHNDSREEVEIKVPGGTMAVKDYRYDVDIRPLELTFHFDPTGKRLLTVSVVYLEPRP